MEWLKKAEDMLQAVDETAKAMSSGQKRIFGEGGLVSTGGPSSKSIQEDEAPGDSESANSRLSDDSLDAKQRPDTFPPSVLSANSSRTTLGAAELLRENKHSEEIKSVHKQKQFKSNKTERQKETGNGVMERVNIADVAKNTTRAEIEADKAMEAENTPMTDRVPPSVARVPPTDPKKPKETRLTMDDKNRLSKLTDALKKKNKTLQNEIYQLEEMLSSSDTRINEYEQEVSKLAESNESLLNSNLELKGRVETLEHELRESETAVETHESSEKELRQALLNMQRESLVATEKRTVSETQMIASLRKDIEAAESMLELERQAHTESRRAFQIREIELEESVTKAASALSESQSKIGEYAEKLMKSQECCTRLEASILDIKTKMGPASADSPSQASVHEQRICDLEKEIEKALRDAANSNNASKAIELEMTHLRQENQDLILRLSSFESSDAIELKGQIKDLTDALYAKQTQIENLSAEKNALRMQVERQDSSKSEGIRRRPAAVDSMFSGADVAYDSVVPMRSLRAYERLTGWKAVEHWVEGFARLLDAIALQAVMLIRQSPLFRLGFFLYMLGMHVFVYILLYWGVHSHPQDRIR
jgi:chromosome segregation ATPase